MAPKSKPRVVIIVRVSSGSQSDGLSLESQVKEIKGYIGDRKMAISSIETHSIVSSAYKRVPETVSTLCSQPARGRVMMFYRVDRFSRNLEKGKEMIESALKRGWTFVFVNEDITLSESTKEKEWCRFICCLVQAEAESRATSTRVAAALDLKRSKGIAFGVSKYGKKKVGSKDDAKFVDDDNEKNVIKFVSVFSRSGAKVSDYNEWLGRVSGKDMKKDGYEFDEKNGKYLYKNVDVFLSDVTDKTLADHLNECGVTKRGAKWTPASVRSVRRDPTLAEIRDHCSNKSKLVDAPVQESEDEDEDFEIVTSALSNLKVDSKCSSRGCKSLAVDEKSLCQLHLEKDRRKRPGFVKSDEGREKKKLRKEVKNDDEKKDEKKDDNENLRTDLDLLLKAVEKLKEKIDKRK